MSDRDAAFDEFWLEKYPKGSTERQMDTAMPIWNAAWQAATERCAKIAETIEPEGQQEELVWNRGHWEDVGRKIANAIRAGKEG